MTEPLLSVCWKNHTSELATVYKSLLENNFLVDCTLSAENRSLKVHRLVLSACSPYFHKLFNEERGMHPFVILLNTSFETLQAVVDFVYQGETQIPEGNLQAFLTLAQSLQIKGLNAFTQNYMNKEVSQNTARNGYVPSEENQDSPEVQDDGACQEDCPESSSQLLSDRSDRYSGSVHTTSSVPFEPCDEVQSASAMPPPQEHQIPVEYGLVTVKHEPLFSVFSETSDKVLEVIKGREHMPESFRSEMDCGTTFVAEQNVIQYPSGSGFSLKNVDSSEVPPPQQQLTQFSDEMASCRSVAEHHQLPLPAVLVPKNEQIDDGDNKKSMDEFDVIEYGTNETDEGTKSPFFEQNRNITSSADGLPLEKDVATQRRSLPGQQSTSSPPHTELQLHEGRRAHPGQQTVLGDEGEIACSQVADLATNKHRSAGSYTCKMCQKTFFSQAHFVRHNRLHTDARPFRCDVCSKGFTQSGDLLRHMRCHTGERPFRCDVCGKGFTQLGNLNTHKRRHTGERPFRCDVCGKGFTDSGHLVSHMRCHTGERPFRCDVCGKGFTQSGNLYSHMRCHTGERPHRCNLCGKGFTDSSHLASHMRSHTGERPHRCDVCGKSFAELSTLRKHMRRHAR